MHRFLHGIRWSFLRPVWAPLQRCLPLLALLQSCPEDGDLLPPIENEDGEGPLLPSQGDENEDGEGPLLPSQGDEREDGEGPLLPSQGDDQENGDGLLPACQSGEQTDFTFSTTAHEEHDGAVASCQSQCAECKSNRTSSHDTDSHSLRESNIFCFHVNLNLPCRSTSSLLHLHDKDDGQRSHHMSLTLPQGSQRHVLNSAKYQQNLLPFYRFNISNAAQIRRVPALGSSDPSSIQASNNDATLPAAAVLAINAWVLPSPRPRVKMKDELRLYHVHAWEYYGWACQASPTFSSILLILFNARLYAKLADPTVALTPLRGSSYGEDVSAPYDCSLWLNSSNGKVGADAYFLIPLRGIKCEQWNDEVNDDDVAAMKTTLWMKMHMRLLYITKDLLDPG